MDGILKALGLAGGVLSLCLGCTTSKPNLKPTNQPETLVLPPKEARYLDPNQAIPKQAWKKPDDPYLLNQSAINQASGQSPPMGRSGMGPGGGY